MAGLAKAILIFENLSLVVYVAFGVYFCHLHVKIDDIITKLNLHQSAFCIDFFNAEIQIPETQLQALLPFPTLPPDRPESLLSGYLFWCFVTCPCGHDSMIPNPCKKDFSLPVAVHGSRKSVLKFPYKELPNTVYLQVWVVWLIAL